MNPASAWRPRRAFRAYRGMAVDPGDARRGPAIPLLSKGGLVKRVLAILVLGVSISACGDGPTVPTVSPTPALPAAPGPAPTGSSVATLAVSSFEVTFDTYFNGRYWYRAAMVLTETSGKSAATLQSISFSIPDGDTFSVAAPEIPNGQGCFLSSPSKAVPAGQTWNLNSVYYYCLDIDSHSDITGVPLTVTVSFIDEDGRPGTVKGTATVKK